MPQHANPHVEEGTEDPNAIVAARPYQVRGKK